MNKKYLSLLIFILLITLAGAESIYRQNEPLNIQHPIRIDGVPSSSISANITLNDPDNLLLFGNGVMSYQTASQVHNYTVPASNLSKLGVYNYCITATNGSLSATECYNFEITLIGQKPTSAQSIIYFILGLLSIIFFFLSLYGALRIKWGNSRNMQGRIMSVNDLKYFKLVLWFVSYLLLIFIFFAFAHVSRIANWELGYKFLNGVFWFLIIFLFPTFVMTCIIGFINFFNDKKVWKALEFSKRGVR